MRDQSLRASRALPVLLRASDALLQAATDSPFSAPYSHQTNKRKQTMNRFIRSPLAAAVVAILAIPATRTTLAATPDETLDEVLVTAQRVGEQLAAERRATPGAVTIIDGESLNERSVTQLADLMRYVPGVWAESYNGNDDVFYSSRGSNLDATDYDKSGVKFLQDGLPVTTADGNNHNRALDPQNARFVTIAHGANALAYGASTLGGAVDFTTPTARTSAPFSAAVGAGSFGQWNLRATAGGVAGALDGLLTVETLQRDGYRGHSDEDRKDVYANAGWQASDDVGTRFYATYSDYYAELPRELSAAAYESDPWQGRPDSIAGNHSKKVKASRVAFKTTVAELAGGTLEFGGSYEAQALFHPIVSSPFFSLLIDTDHKDSGAMLRYRRESGAHNLVFGANYGYSTVKGGNYENDGGKRGAFMFPTDNKASSLELFALDNWQLAPRWTLVYGTQFISAKRNIGAPPKGDYDALNPRLGLIFDINGQSQWFSSVSRTYEAPTTFVLVDQASGGSNPLDAMNGIVAESGLRGHTGDGSTRWNWEVTGYYTQLQDEILSKDIGGTSSAGNFDTAHAGIESLLGASFALGEGGSRIEPLLSFTFNAFSFDSDADYGNNRLPSAPRFFARGEVMYRNAMGFSAGPTFDFVGRRYVDFANTYQVGSHGLLGARVAFSADRWEVFAEGRNLLDRKYVATVLVKDQYADGNQVLFPGAPRAVYAGARYRF
jgi:iron complex outermembrane receptor protein